jgi:hypothetical protein
MHSPTIKTEKELKKNTITLKTMYKLTDSDDGV